MPLDAKAAARQARKYLSEMMGGQPYNLVLEEVELSSDKKQWIVTLSYNENLFVNIKSYKVFTINAHTGDVTSMKIKETRKS